ncbi:hypothetical protein AAMO2058_000723000 [Amorphochlora amoebiformis]
MDPMARAVASRLSGKAFFAIILACGMVGYLFSSRAPVLSTRAAQSRGITARPLCGRWPVATSVSHGRRTFRAEAEERKRRSYGDELSPEAQAELDAWKRQQDGMEDEEGFTLQNLDISKIDAVTVNAVLFTIIGFNFFILPFVDFTGMLSAIVGKPDF